MLLNHRDIVAAIALSLGMVAGCKQSSDVRCGTCGMKVDAKSAFASTLAGVDGATSTRHFDSTKCALSARKPGDALTVHEYYSGVATQAGNNLRFVTGSDVVGPMGHDFVPVASEMAAQFQKEHGGKTAYTLGEIPADKAVSLAE
jgi:copper chaperone NosL